MRIKRFLVIGAHPDDADLMFGGCAVKLAGQGHKVKFVSCCNGNAGHYSEKPEALAARRRKEATKAAAVAKITEYEILDNHDCKIVPTIENRERITGIIRDFKPDVVISHRTCDYMADHRITAQLVQDSAYLIMVPLFCPKHKVPEKNPIYIFSHDTFKKPCPFMPDMAVAIDDVVQEKIGMLNCHESQFYEWLPYTQGKLKEVPVSEGERRKWLAEGWLPRDRSQADSAREQLKARYGKSSLKVKYAETFELSEYGRQPEPGELNALFPL